jgi:hypothetical protein
MTAFDSALLNAFTWLARIGSLLVILGCFLEAAELIISWARKSNFRKWIEVIFGNSWRRKIVFSVKFIEPRILKFETLGFAILFIGLGLELFSSFEVESIQSRESDRLTKQLDSTTQKASAAEKETAELNDRASSNELAAKQLEIQLGVTKTQLATAQANLIDLQNANLPMEIGSQTDFAVMIAGDPVIPVKDLRKIPIKIRTLANDKAHKTATDLEIAFVFFGNWIIIDRANIDEIGESGIIIGYRYDDDLSEKAARLLMKALTARNVPSKIMTSDENVRFEGIPTNGVMVVVCNRPDPLNEKLMLVQAKQSELSLQPVGLEMEIWKLQQEKFVMNSEEYRKAQLKYNDLTSQYTNTQNEISALNESEKKLKSEIDKAAFGTNSPFRISGLIRFDPTTGSFGEKIVK